MMMHQCACRRGISAYVGVILIVALSVAGGAIFLQLSGLLSDVRPGEEIESSGQMVLDSASLTYRELKVYVRNKETASLSIDRVYVDGVLTTGSDYVIEVNEPGDVDDGIPGGEVGVISVQPLQGFKRGKNYSFKIISTENSIIEFSREAPLEAPVIIFTNSTRVGVPGVEVKYYSGGWKRLGATNENGEIVLLLDPRSYNFRLTYGGATQQKTQNIADNKVVKFRTYNVTVGLCKTNGEPLPGATAQYYASGWKTIGDTNERGVVSVDLLPLSYNFRITFGGATLQKTQDVNDNPVVRFQTNETTVRLVSSLGARIEGALVEYYASGWKTVGTTNADGEVMTALMPMSYNFRVSYGGASQQKSQNIGVDPLVVFSTNLVTVSFVDSLDNPVSGATAQYYASGWKAMGATNVDGEVSVELLPMGYNFRLTYGGATLQKTQNIVDDPVVEYQTVNVTVSVVDGSGPVEGVYASYYASGWKNIGYTDLNGVVSIEVLPMSYNFRVSYEGSTYTKNQDAGDNQIVEFILE